MFYIVISENNDQHFIEANSPGEAINSVPGGESVRIALSNEIIANRPDLVQETEEEPEE